MSAPSRRQVRSTRSLPTIQPARRGNAVIMSKDDYDALTETAYLLRNPANAERLLEAVERARRGEFEQHDLVDP